MMLVVHVVDDANSASLSMSRSLPANFPYAPSTRDDITRFWIQANKVFEFDLCQAIPDMLYSSLIGLRFNNNLRY